MVGSKQPESPRDVAVRLLARREYARAELQARLSAKGYMVEETDTCLDALAEQGLQCDERFAEIFVRSRVARGQGPLKIRAELGVRGIDREGIQAALCECERSGEVDWLTLASETLARRFSVAPGNNIRERARCERFLASRGFAAEQVRHAMQHAWQEE